MFSSLRISQKILLVTLSVSLVAVIVSSVAGALTSKNALEQAAFERLTAVRELKAQQIEGYFGLLDDQASFLASDPTTINALTAMAAGVDSIADSSALPPVDDELLGRFYSETFAEFDVDSIDLVPTDPVTGFLQVSYLVAPSPDGSSNPRLADEADEIYHTAHAAFDPYLTSFSDTFGFYDVFLVDASSRRIVYSAEKEVDYATSLLDGPYSGSNLAEVTEAALSASDGQVTFTDFRPYVPSFGAMAAFIAAPIFDDGVRIGAIALQIPVDRINSTMTSHEMWADVGLGESGETYLVGPDFLMRSQSRFLIEDKDGYLQLMRDLGVADHTVELMGTQESSIGLQEVNTEGTRAALAGQSEEAIFGDYRDIDVLSSYRPLDLPGLDWVIMSEINEAEAFAAFASLRNRLFFFVAALIALASVSAYYLARTITRPIRSLQVSAQSLAAGALDEPVQAESSDEIGELAVNFEKMRSALNASFAEVERQNAELETKVRDRTADLDEALQRQGHQNDELEQRNAELVQIQSDLLESQRDLQQSRERINKIVQSSPDGIIAIDRRGVVETFSASAEQLFGYYASEVIGKNVKMLMPEQIAEDHDHYLAQYYTGKPSSIVHNTRLTDALRKDGSIFPMELKVEEVEFEHDESIFIGIIRDISQRLQMEAEILEATERAERANEAKSAFLANMSHELRTPMNAIIGYSEMLAEDAEEDGLDEMLDDLRKMNFAGKHLLELINDVLDLSKIEAGRMDVVLETIPVTEMVQNVIDTARGLVERNGNTISFTVADNVGEIYADLTKVRQMLLNLISNAAKFTSNGSVSLEVERYLAGDDQWVRLSVSDSGIGIPPDKLEAIFQEFSQADETTTRNFGGTGLGLSLTRRFAQMMGGDITVESVVGEGSTFSVEIPAEVVLTPQGLEPEASMSETTIAEGSSATRAPVIDQFDSSGANALVIDDDETARDLLSRALAHEGWNVITAANGAEGLRLAAEMRPSLITLDVLMPGMDGWTVLRRLKANPELRDIPVVMVSMVGDKTLGYQLGAVESLQKPIDRSRLRELIAQYATVSEMTVLIVEDDEAARKTIKKVMEGENWEVTTAENGAIGLDRAAEQQFDLILLDLMMPVVDGFEFLQTLRTGRLLSSDSPVVVLTAKTLDEADRAMLEGAVHQVVAKSGADLETLVSDVRKYLGRS